MSVHSKILNLISLESKTAIVTGAASGIGSSVARRLAEAGANIALLDIDEQRGPKVEKEIQQLGAKAKFYACDVSLYSDCESVIDGVSKEFGNLDILVNNAGVISRKDIVELSEEEWDHVLRINLKSVYQLSHSVIPRMVQNGGGSIVNIGSGWGIKGGPKAIAYCASKGGVVNLTRAMAIDHGKQGIRVNCVCPGDVHTALLEREAAQMHQDFDSFLVEAADRPIPRVGSPEDVANAVLFLACELSSWVTGSVFVVDGGGLA
ncbi:MAG: SDR family oxidoreductase [Candidatus Aminicenantes bacterium]|nr:MAG: SDR family oxidoreductase [Candidatus Aminicenantes bacterium]